MMFFKSKSKPREENYRSHLCQDRWVDLTLGFQKSGYFLDFGAFDGVDMSNSYFLEVERSWMGLCVEPNPVSFSRLCACRRTVCVNSALWPTSRQSLEFIDSHGLSSFSHLQEADSNSKNRQSIARRLISVDTINPTELLDRFDAPRSIDYLSLDVEGAEMDILRSLDLERYEVSLMTIEQDCNPDRIKALREYLLPFGYEGFSVSYDEFFYKKSKIYRVPPREAAARIGIASAEGVI